MGELKPIGSEKLSTDEKLKRILELTYYQRPNNSAKTSRSSELVVESTTGAVYGIVKEKDGYYVKKGLNESTLDYIGGMFMKNKNKFSSYSEALKRLELIKGQEELQEATKYVIKQNKPAPPQQTEAPIPAPPMPEAPPPAPTDDGSIPPPPDSGMDDLPPSPEDGIPSDDGMGQQPSEDDYLKVIQKLSGRLGQKLRQYQEKLESNDIKYVINMVLSAVDLDKLKESDREEILDKFEDDENYDDGMGGESPDMDEPSEPAPSGEDGDLDETMDTLENLINTPWEEDDMNLNDMEGENVPEDEFDSDVDFSDIYDDDEENFEGHSDDNYYEGDGHDVEHSPRHEDDMDETHELDIDELTNMIHHSVKQTLGKYFK